MAVPIRRASVPIGAAVPSLSRWGLSSDADLVFRTLATMGPLTARVLARELGLSARRIDDALAELAAAGAAVTGEGPRAAWESLPAADVIARLRRRRMRLVDRDGQVRTHLAVVSGLTDQVSGVPVLGDGVRYLPSRDLTRLRLGELMECERDEHLTINTEQSFDAAATRGVPQRNERIAARRIRTRVLGLPPADGDRHVDAALFDQPFYGYREAPEVPMKLFVVDRRVALFPADPADVDRGYLEISQPGVVSALIMLFEKHWATATDPREFTMPDIVLSDRERELIVLLAQGHTDVTAAEHMRVSTRLITKILRGLMDRLGVENRFQLGLVLGAARGASLPPPSPGTARNTPASGAVRNAPTSGVARNAPSSDAVLNTQASGAAPNAPLRPLNREN